MFRYNMVDFFSSVLMQPPSVTIKVYVYAEPIMLHKGNLRIQHRHGLFGFKTRHH